MSKNNLQKLQHSIDVFQRDSMMEISNANLNPDAETVLRGITQRLYFVLSEIRQSIEELDG